MQAAGWFNTVLHQPGSTFSPFWDSTPIIQADQWICNTRSSRADTAMAINTLMENFEIFTRSWDPRASSAAKNQWYDCLVELSCFGIDSVCWMISNTSYRSLDYLWWPSPLANIWWRSEHIADPDSSWCRCHHLSVTNIWLNPCHWEVAEKWPHLRPQLVATV